MSYFFQIKLKSVRVIENGKIEPGEGVNALSVTLFYPREGVPSVSSVRSLKLPDNNAHTFSDTEFREQLLLKEIVRGDALLEIELSAVEKVTKFEKLVHKLFGLAFNTALGAVPVVGAVGSLITGVISKGLESVFAASDPADKITVIGRASWLINESTPEGDLPITLQAPSEVVLRQPAMQNGQTVEIQKRIPKGFNNGQVILEIKKIKLGEGSAMPA